MSGSGLKRMVVKGRIAYYCQLFCEPIRLGESMVVPQKINDILIEYDHLFSEPSELPPDRQMNHRIILNPNTAPINVHPYRYPQFQKNEIEQLM